MGLDKAIEHGKEKRKPYYGSKSFDHTCRNHGGCLWCEENRKFKFRDKHPPEEGETDMRLFTNCSGECCVCSVGGGCLAGHGDDDYSPASAAQVIRRLKRGEYANSKNTMITYLRSLGVEYNEAGN